MKTSETITNIAAALAKFQADCPAPKKTATNPHFNSKYSPLEEILNTIKPFMAANGLSQLQSTTTEGEQIGVKTILLHSSGEFIEFDTLWLPMGKVNAQGAGSSVTYARRYSLCAALGIAADEDDDGNVASNPQPQSKPPISSKQVGLIKTLTGKFAKMCDKSPEDVYAALKITDITQLNVEQASAAIDQLNKWIAAKEAQSA